MTAKLRHGKNHRGTRGADAGTPHERLNARHAMPGRAEGAMHPTMAPPPPSPVPSAPPAPDGNSGGMPSGGGMPGAPGMSMAPPGIGPQEGDES